MPGASVLERLVARLQSRVQERLWRLFMIGLSPANTVQKLMVGGPRFALANSGGMRMNGIRTNTEQGPNASRTKLAWIPMDRTGLTAKRYCC